MREPTAATAGVPPNGGASEAAEARRLIEAQLHAHVDAVGKCLQHYLDKNNAWGDATLDFAIDQGTLVGVVVSCSKTSGKDPELNACMAIALHDAIFPKSRWGVLMVREEWDGF